MSLINYLTPVYYRVAQMEIVKDLEVVAEYRVDVLNATGHQLDRLDVTALLTPQEKAALAAIFTRDKAAFETNTGLTEWTEP